MMHDLLWDGDENPFDRLEDVDPDDLAFGFHIETLPEEDEDGYVELRP